MRCENCKKRVSKNVNYCPSCGSKIENPVVDKEDKPKKKYQIFKIIMIIFITFIAITSSIVLIYVNKHDYNDLLSELFKYDWWIVINIFTFFVASFYVILAYAFGWFGCVIVAIIGIILSLLTMIKATKIKKIILSFLIIAFIIIICFAIMTAPITNSML